MPDIRFTPEAQTAVEFAHQAAAELGHSYIGTEHLLLGLLRQEGGVAARALQEQGLRDEMVTDILQRIMGRGLSGADPQSLTPRCRTVLELAAGEAGAQGAIDTAHLLLGLLREGSNTALRILRTVGIDPRQLSAAVRRKMAEAAPAPAATAGAAPRDKKSGKTMEEFTRDLTAAAR
ncbi:MAG: ATP-dependent Clp protease ATP-binding subunit, partial [Oscillospiraceae bacterium]|nr:ATP-dependent Clp protease ATP-binding subunit [Oscillospiraceae bacterium]